MSDEIKIISESPELITNNQKRPKVAIIMWGLVRSLEYTLDSIKKNVFEQINKKYDYDIFMHTYKLNNYIDNNYKLLNPDFIKIDIQDEIIKKIDFKKYSKHGVPWKGNVKLLRNFILALYSKKQATRLFIEEFKHNKNYKYIIFMRPDLKYLQPLKLEWFKKLNDKTGIVPNFHHFKGLNDRFFMGNIKNGIKYGFGFDKLAGFAKRQKAHSERFNGFLLRKVNRLNIHRIPFFFQRIRINGEIAGNDRRFSKYDKTNKKPVDTNKKPNQKNKKPNQKNKNNKRKKESQKQRNIRIRNRLAKKQKP
jgi:hypothetical protein